MTLKEQFASIYSFALKQLGEGTGKLTRDQLDEVYEAWKREQTDFEESVADIQAGLDDAKAGRVSSIDDVDRRIRQRRGFPPAE